MAGDIEIELKFPLKNGEELVTFLDKRASFKKESRQHDIYYNPPDRDLLKNPKDVNEWFRVRLNGDSAQINYKDFQPHGERLKTHCIEYETDVASYDQLEKILRALGFTKLTDVKKLRKIWEYKDAEISLDAVDELGDYLEIEYKGGLTDVDEVRNYLFSILKEIRAATGEIEIHGYPYLLLVQKGLLKA
jgi:adenylate cyclase, class 2